MLGLNSFLPGADGPKLMQFLQALRTKQPRPIEEMSELQTRAWLLLQTMLTEMGIEDPLRSLLLRMGESFSDEQLLTMMRGLLRASDNVREVLIECGDVSLIECGDNDL